MELTNHMRVGGTPQQRCMRVGIVGHSHNNGRAWTNNMLVLLDGLLTHLLSVGSHDHPIQITIIHKPYAFQDRSHSVYVDYITSILPLYFILVISIRAYKRHLKVIRVGEKVYPFVDF